MEYKIYFYSNNTFVACASADNRFRPQCGSDTKTHLPNPYVPLPRVEPRRESRINQPRENGRWTKGSYGPHFVISLLRSSA